MLTVALISPYHGGSHRAWARGYQANSQHQVQLYTRPARFWKWRMHGGAVTLARQFTQAVQSAPSTRPDVLLVTDMLDVTTFQALTKTTLPVILYMHENQLTYPLPARANTGPMRRQHGERDYHYAFINYASMLAADGIWFNSRYHHDSWFAALPRYLHRFPEDNELDSVADLQARSQVMTVGIDWNRSVAARPDTPTNPDPPLILWNQRWEYDKDPGTFFDALYTLQAEGYTFRLALCGENFRRRPQEFNEALDRLSAQIIHVGHAPRERYHALLWEADITISTALHEFLGISILEAISCQTFPILPHRLSYPELIPEHFHSTCLYTDQDGLLERLRWAITRPEERRVLATALAQAVQHFSWENVAPAYDRALDQLVSEKAGTG